MSVPFAEHFGHDYELFYLHQHQIHVYYRTEKTKASEAYM